MSEISWTYAWVVYQDGVVDVVSKWCGLALFMDLYTGYAPVDRTTNRGKESNLSIFVRI